jgi:hypothetical protein
MNVKLRLLPLGARVACRERQAASGDVANRLSGTFRRRNEVVDYS